MKKQICAAMIVVMILSAVACGSKTDSTTAQTQAAQTETVSESAETKETAPQKEETTKSEKIEVDENLLTVEVTLGASFFEDSTPEEIEASAKEKGYLSCKINDDGSVTYTMTRLKRDEMLKEYAASLEETIQGYLSGEDAVESFRDIRHNDDFSQFDIYVDKEKYSMWDNLYALSFYMAGAFYQNFAGVDSDDIDIIVNYIDEATGEQLESGSYKKWIAKQKENAEEEEQGAEEEK